MQDLSPPEYQRRESVRRALSDFLALRGYWLVDTPTLEETELFLRKSGGELAAKMYSFTDPGGNRVSLRPEFTASVLRAYLESEPPPPLPYRVQYCGAVFRHEGLEERPAYRQFTQLGAELLGSAHPLADVEVLSLTCGGLAAVGVQGLRLTIGHMGAILDALAGFGLSERARLFLLSSVAELRSGGAAAMEQVRNRAASLGLLSPGGTDSASANVSPQQAEAVVQSLLREPTEALVGNRTREEVMARFLRKLQGADDPAQVERALEFTARLVAVDGPPATSLEQAAALMTEYRLAPGALDGCRAVMELLGHADLAGVPFSLDFGLARGIAYYTGLVFELHHSAISGEPSLGGGGRYDGLTRALAASQDVPALGFAWSLERVLEALGRQPEGALEETSRGVLIATAGMSAERAALAAAERRWGRGESAELDVSRRSLEENLEYARSRGLEAVVLVNERGDEQRYDVAPAGGGE